MVEGKHSNARAGVVQYIERLRAEGSDRVGIESVRVKVIKSEREWALRVVLFCSLLSFH